MTQLGIVADDLTGAMDTGVQSAKAGLRAVVMLGNGELPPAEMVVISTDSRDEPAEVAYRHAREAAGRLAGRLVYKKMDSTLRGNLGAEIDGMLDGLRLERALVAPAFPNTGRTTEGGYHKVHGVLLSESAFARDPVWPATESHLPTIIARQTRRAVGHLSLEVVEQGPEEVIEALKREKAPIVAADAVESRHLRTLAEALVRMDRLWLPAGCAGLAEEWIAALGAARSGEGGIGWSADSRPVLVVAGSRNRTTAAQLQEASRRGLAEIV
ncbi:MAG TPA: four-carbon acid sugar kinase family protein, partial [Chloroflexota bacterium]|nr:four-carbon acid sugar kinase family protein [Chloroflexota bacterium]